MTLIHRLAAVDVKTGNCPIFTATPYVFPISKRTGNRYHLFVSDSEMSCARVTTWARKIIAQHVSGQPDVPVPVKRWPAGLCVPSRTGREWPRIQGDCTKQGGGDSSPTFSWQNA